MSERIENVTVRPAPDGPITGMHVAVVERMGRTMVEVRITRNYSLAHPIVELRAVSQANILYMPHLAGVIWSLGQELQEIGHEWMDNED